MKKILWLNQVHLLNPIEGVTILSKNIINSSLNKFYLEIVSKVKDNQHILFIPRVQLSNNQIISLSNKLEINNDKSIKDSLLSILMDKINLSNDTYKDIPLSKIIFSYSIREGVIIPKINIKKENIKTHTYYKNKLPLGYLPSDYGKILIKYIDNYTISLNKNVTINLTVSKDGNNNFNNISYIKNGNILFTWKDKLLEQNKFIRYIGKTIIHFENGEVNKFKILKTTSGMTNKILPINNSLSNKFITLDIETILINNNHIPYLISWYDGSTREKQSYFIKNLD